VKATLFQLSTFPRSSFLFYLHSLLSQISFVVALLQI
jgi:hypothetical protein